MAEAQTVDEYLAGLPEDRRTAIGAVREVVLEHLPPGFTEVMQYGGISYVIPLAEYPKTYNGQPLTILTLANQKRHMALYLMGLYGQDGGEAWLRERWAATGKKLDLGKSCLRFRSLDDLDLGIVGEAIGRINREEFIAAYERSRTNRAG